MGRRVNRRVIAGVVYEIEFTAQGGEPEPEEGTITGFWNGDTDTWGKMTICTVDGTPPHYLFPREITSAERIAR